MEKHVLALDFGASSARAVLGVMKDGAFTMTELHRWENEPIPVEGRLCWNIPALMAGSMRALTLAREAGGVDSIGIDTWGVDFGLLDEEGKLMEPPVHYRDGRAKGMMDLAFQRMSKERLYEITGNQLMEINTLYQLLSLKTHRPEVLQKVRTLLMTPDLLAYLLTGSIGAEYTICSTSQLLDCRTGRWSAQVLSAMDLPNRILPPVSRPGGVRGVLTPALQAETGLGPVPVISTPGHDTACAVAAVETRETPALFLSCGTWSLLGTLLPRPVTTPLAMESGFTNEGGWGGSIRFLTNLTGLWLVQECRRQWRQEGRDYSYAQLDAWAAEYKTAARIDTQAPELAVPGDLAALIGAQCAKGGQTPPQTPGEVVRCIYESLADCYLETARKLTACTGQAFRSLNLVGGGAQGRLLPQLTANRLGLPVHVGPVEATVLGNLSVQLTALGCVRDMDEARRLTTAQAPIRTYFPKGV